MFGRRRKPRPVPPSASIALHASAALVALRQGDADEVERRLWEIHRVSNALTGQGPFDDYAVLANAIYGSR